MTELIIVLGCTSIDSDGNPEGSLKNRLDLAMALYDLHAAPILVTGGGWKEWSEASVMRKYLVDSGIPERDVHMEDESMNTAENILNCRQLCSIAFPELLRARVVSSDYHIQRVERLTGKLWPELQAEFFGAETPDEEYSKRADRERTFDYDRCFSHYLSVC